MIEGLGAYIKRERAARGWTQRTLAERAGFLDANGEPDRSLIAQVESGRTKMPLPDARRKLAAALGVPHVALLVAAGELTDDEARIPAPTIDPARQRVLDALHGLELGEGEMDHLNAVIGSLKRDRKRREARGRSAGSAVGSRRK
jgi:transcriptional regulator with XRE-family HTH domain